MEYLTLNNSIKMPILGLGTWDLRGPSGYRAILSALTCGYRLIDTAKMYANEDIVGKACKDSNISREELFITTKFSGSYASYEGVRSGIDESISLFNDSYIDLALIHEPYGDIFGMYEALKEALYCGKVRAVGISNFNKDRYLSFIERCGLIPAVNQIESHVYFSQLDFKQLLNDRGTQMQAWASFTEGSRNVFLEPVLVEIAEKYNKTAAQVVLRYQIEYGIAVIPKSADEKRQQENLNVFDFNLSTEDKAQILRLDRKKSLFNWY